jgi:uncharacterized protein
MESYRRGSGHDVALLTVKSLGGEPIERYSLRVAREWKLGSVEKNDGALLVVAKDDREMRIEVGRGLEGTLPDIVCGRIIRDVLTPAFQRGDFAGGLVAGRRGAAAGGGRRLCGAAGAARAARRGGRVALRRRQGDLRRPRPPPRRVRILPSPFPAIRRQHLAVAPGGQRAVALVARPWLRRERIRRWRLRGGGFGGGGGGFGGFGGGGGFSGGGASGDGDDGDADGARVAAPRRAAAGRGGRELAARLARGPSSGTARSRRSR